MGKWCPTSRIFGQCNLCCKYTHTHTTAEACPSSRLRDLDMCNPEHSLPFTQVSTCNPSAVSTAFLAKLPGAGVCRRDGTGDSGDLRTHELPGQRRRLGREAAATSAQAEKCTCHVTENARDDWDVTRPTSTCTASTEEDDAEAFPSQS